MINYELPVEIEINDTKYPIRNKGDYRMMLDVIAALDDEELERDDRIRCALYIFYEDITAVKDIKTAAGKMMEFINLGESESGNDTPSLMNWAQDFKIIVPPINGILGFEVRSAEYLHWWTFMGAYMEIGEGTFRNVISIRKKKRTEKKLEKWEEEFYRENRKMIDLPMNLSPEERELLEADW